jgi:hypothetical protein
MKIISPDEHDIKNPEQSILTIYSGAEHLSFSLHNPEEKGSFYYKELTDKNQPVAFTIFKEVFLEQAFFSLPFLKVRIMNRTQNFTYIPSIFYDDKYKEDYIHFLFSDRKETTLRDSLISAGITVLYQISEDVYNFMVDFFPKPEFNHYSTPMIAYFLKKNRNINTRKMVVNLQETGLDIFCYSGKTLLLGNYFPCKGLQDALYYVLYTWKQLQLNQLDDCLLITGNSAFKEVLIKKLALYIQQIRFPGISPEIHFNGIETGRIPFELLTLSVCGS